MVAECGVLNHFGYGYVFHGGLKPCGTVTITVPDDDHWVLVVDLEGLSHAVTVSAVRISRPRAPAAEARRQNGLADRW